jgi:hypothetical protein
MAEHQHPLWIEQLGELELSDLHWKMFNEVLSEDWKNEARNELLEQLLHEMRIRMGAQ